MDLHILWFALLGVLLTGYAILDGFDLGVGILHLGARSDRERRVILNSIGPIWDGNEVWLVTFGGAMFAAFPEAYATVFSGFYDAFMLVLFALILRAVSLEFRGKLGPSAWRSFWDGGFFLASLLATLLFGVAVGAILIGVPLDARGIYAGSFLDLLLPARLPFFPVLVGLLTVALFALHGALYLNLKTEGGLQARVRRWMWHAFGWFLVLYLLTTIVTLTEVPKATGNFDRFPWAWAGGGPLGAGDRQHPALDLPRPARPGVRLLVAGDRDPGRPGRRRPLPQPGDLERGGGHQPDDLQRRLLRADARDHGGDRRRRHAVRARLHRGDLLGLSGEGPARRPRLLTGPPPSPRSFSRPGDRRHLDPSAARPDSSKSRFAWRRGFAYYFLWLENRKNIDRFRSPRDPPHTMGSPAPSLPDADLGVVPAVKTLVVTDLVDSTRLLSSVGDRRAAELSALHERLARDLLVECGGREIDKTDGFLLLFDRTADAVRYALAYHRGLAALAVAQGVDLAARVGVHLGEIFLRSNPPEDVARGAKPVELEGFAKMIAARVMGLAKERQTLLTRAAFDLARQSAAHEKLADDPLRWLAHGPYLLKGIAEPVEVFEVGVSGFAPLVVPKSTAKARRAVSAGDEITLGWRPAPGLEVPRRAHWMLVEKLGEGGFGEVWLAHHEKTAEARVFKFCYQADRLRSLQREVTLFRLLKETLGTRDDIARILEWNFERAPYFLECEYTEGGNLLEWVAEQGGPGTVPLATKLELMAEVADALAAAHSVGVLHKDVKPSNVLITTDGQGTPKVRLTDFGVGLITDRELLFRQGITVFDLTEMVADSATSAGGTHLYMAPELVEGRTPTVQADLYALGVMLYQFVTGDFTRALAPGWHRDVEDDLLREDLAQMVEGRPERRLRDAQEVADRLRTLDRRRALRQAEEKARREREAERVALERAQRRRRTSLAIAGVAVVVLAVVSYLAVQAVQARREAERRRGQAESLIGFMVGDLRKKLEPIGRLDVLDDVGDHALEYFDAVPESDLSDEEVFRRSETLRQIGQVRTSRGDLPAARKAYVESLGLAERLVQRDPDNGDWQKGLGASHFWIGFVDWRQNDLERAEGEFRRYQAVAEAMAAKRPDDPEWQLEVAYAHSNLGSVLQARGQLERALEEFQRTLAIKEKLVAGHPADTAYRLDLAVSYNSAGSALEALGRLTDALALYRKDLAIKQALVASDPTNTQWRQRLAVSHNYVSKLEEWLGDPVSARRDGLAARRIMADLSALDPTNGRWRRELAINYLRTAGISQRSLELDAALADAGTGLEILRKLVADDPSDARWRTDLADASQVLGGVLLAQGKLAAARESLERARGILASQLQKEPDNRAVRRLLGRVDLDLGGVEERDGQARRAGELRRLAVATLEPLARGSKDPAALDPWVRSLLSIGQAEEAREQARALVALGYREPDFLEYCRHWNLLPKELGVPAPSQGTDRDPSAEPPSIRQGGERHARHPHQRRPLQPEQDPGPAAPRGGAEAQPAHLALEADRRLDHHLHRVQPAGGNRLRDLRSASGRHHR